MLQDIRKSSQGTVAKIIVGAIIVTFALFGVESIVGGLGGEPEVAQVNGEGISESRFARALEGRRRQILAQMGENADPDLIDESFLRTTVLEGLIQEQVQAQDANSKGLFVSEDAIDSYIRSVEQFQADGVFSNERLQVILRNAGLTLKDYRDSLRMQFMLSQPRTALVSSAFVLDKERKEIVELDRQERAFGVATAFKRDFLDKISVGDEDVATSYEENKTRYKKPKNADVSFIEVTKAVLAEQFEISEDDLRTMYESEKENYVGEEERQVSHILVKMDDTTSEDEALKKINEIKTQLQAGSAFDVLAKEHSQDEGSAENGGDLGLSARGVYVSDFEAAAFSLSVGEVSEPVKTEFGFHLIKLTAVETNTIPEYEEMRATIEERLLAQKTDQSFAELTERLADLSYASPDLEEPAEELGLVVKQLAGVSPETQDRIFSNPKVQKQLFSDDLLKEENNSELIEIEDGHAIVFRVNTFYEASVLPLEEVRGQVRNALKENKTTDYATSVGQAFIARVLAGETPEDVSKDMGLDWKVHNKIRRDNFMLNQALVTKVFTLKKSSNPKDNIAGFSVLDGDYSVIILTSISEGESKTATALENQSATDKLKGSYGASDFRIYQDAIVKLAEIERI